MRQQIEAVIQGARTARELGRIGEARNGYEKAASLARAAGESALLAHSLRHMSELDRKSQNTLAALNAGQEAVALYRAMPDALPLDLANALRVAALAIESHAKSADAAGIWREARELYAGIGVAAGVAECDEHLKQFE
jgi:hypothetical protein